MWKDDGCTTVYSCNSGDVTTSDGSCDPVTEACSHSSCVCKLGFYKNENDTCVGCDAGSFLTPNGCQLCPRGTFTEQPGARRCTSCGAGMTTDSQGANNASMCIGEWFTQCIHRNKPILSVESFAS